TTGVGVDYETALKAKISGGNEPDIFVNFGQASLEPYMDRAMDLSNEPWVERLNEEAKLPTLFDGKLYGMPQTMEVQGFIYNKDLFEQAGITSIPEPLTLEALEEIMKTLQDEGIMPLINGFKDPGFVEQPTQGKIGYKEDGMKFSQDVLDGKERL